jgi:hypothetical protein
MPLSVAADTINNLIPMSSISKADRALNLSGIAFVLAPQIESAVSLEPSTRFVVMDRSFYWDDNNQGLVA